jgi:hypothetical protein
MASSEFKKSEALLFHRIAGLNRILLTNPENLVNPVRKNGSTFT